MPLSRDPRAILTKITDRGLRASAPRDTSVLSEPASGTRPPRRPRPRSPGPHRTAPHRIAAPAAPPSARWGGAGRLYLPGETSASVDESLFFSPFPIPAGSGEVLETDAFFESWSVSSALISEAAQPPSGWLQHLKANEALNSITWIHCYGFGRSVPTAVLVAVAAYCELCYGCPAP